MLNHDFFSNYSKSKFSKKIAQHFHSPSHSREFLSTAWASTNFLEWMCKRRYHTIYPLVAQAFTIANQISPIIPPKTMAAGAGSLNHMPPTKLVAVTTTHQGSFPRGEPFWSASSMYPISQSRYTAVYTRPTADAFTPRRQEVTDGCLLRDFHRPIVPVWMNWPGEKMAI